jgi:hypothetical protein
MVVLFKDIYQAYKVCHKGKAKSIAGQIYSANILDNLYETTIALQTSTYFPKLYTTFVANNGAKPREVFAADFSDRVVHHYLVSRLEKIIAHKFIHHSCANQLGKGTHFGVSILQKMLRKKTHNTHYLQLDIFNFFYSIDKNILLTILKKHLKTAIKNRRINTNQAQDYYNLCKKIISTIKQNNYLSKHQLKGVPTHKQMANTPNNKGLPIGNLTSQFFGNVYLNELDQFIKHTLKVKNYVRYVDDFILLGSKPQLEIWQQEIINFLKENLSLKLKDEKILQPIDSGIDFLGYITYPHYKLVRKRVVHNCYKKLKHWQNSNIIKTNTGCIIDLNKDNTHTLNSMLSSYIGHFKHAKYYKILEQKTKQFPWLKLLFYQDSDKYLSTTYNKFAINFKQQKFFL